LDKFCYSCAAPLGLPDFKGPAENFCKFCTDEAGKLKEKEVIQQGIAHWFRGWQPKIDEKEALHRAALYMKSMPAWAEK